MSRNANGIGYARKRGKTWQIEVTVDWHIVDGKQVQIRKTKCGFRTKTEALRYAMTLKENPDIPKATETFQEIYTRWCEFYAPRIAESTMKCYKAAFSWFKPVWGRHMEDITVAELQKCIDECPRGRSTLDDMRSVCSLVYKYARANKLISEMNPAAYLYTAGKSKGTHDPLSMEELAKVREAVGVVPYADYVYCLCYLGYRPTEMLSMKKSQYDRAHQCLIAGIKTEAGKNRIVTISPKIQPLIDAQFEKPGDLLFPGPEGEEMDDEDFRVKCFFPLMKALGIKGKVPYSCRHTFANLLKNVTGSDVDKASLIGHADPSMTKYYQSPEYANLKAITDRI